MGYFHNRLFPAPVPQDRRYSVTFEILEAYCDDSGSTSESVLVVGGLLTNPERWRQLEEEWVCALDKWGLPFFHMTDFENRQGPYRDWDDAIHKERLNQLLGIMNKRIIFGFGVGIPLAAYKAAMSPRAKRFYGPYGLAATICLQQVKKHLDEFLKHFDARVAYFFEQGTPGFGQIQKASNLNWERFRLASVTTMMKTHPPTQAADIMAYELFKDLQRKLRLHEKPERYPLRRLRFQDRSWTYLGEPALRAISDQIDATPRRKRRSG